jgi:hypothetical protein
MCLFFIIMLVGLQFIFQEVGGYVKFCAIGRQPKTSTHLWVDILKTLHAIQWKTQGEKL